MIHVNVVHIKDPSKQDLSLEFCKNKNKSISILTESHINLDQIQHIKRHWLAPSFSLLENHSDGLPVMLHPDHTDHADPKWRFLSLQVTPSDDRVLCVYVPSEQSTKKQLTRGVFL